jgi:hypothetical protein
MEADEEAGRVELEHLRAELGVDANEDHRYHASVSVCGARAQRRRRNLRTYTQRAHGGALRVHLVEVRYPTCERVGRDLVTVLVPELGSLGSCTGDLGASVR